MRRLTLLASLVLAAACGLRSGVRPASAEGAVLDGLMAPELTFPAGLNGIARGQSLSSFRGKVVWIKFWLRDCPHCRKSLPLAQQLHELYGNSGLVVLTIVHQYAPDEVKPFMDQHRYTFPVACDPTGALAQAYQVDRRPTDYVVGIDGRVRVSNSGPEDVLQDELARFRLAELGKVPAGMEGARERVRAWDYGAALKLARAAAEPVSAPAEVRDFAQRLEALAGERLAADIARAQVLVRLGRADEALALLRSLAAGFAGTPHEARAREALAAREAAAGR